MQPTPPIPKEVSIFIPKSAQFELLKLKLEQQGRKSRELHIDQLKAKHKTMQPCLGLPTLMFHPIKDPYPTGWLCFYLCIFFQHSLPYPCLLQSFLRLLFSGRFFVYGPAPHNTDGLAEFSTLSLDRLHLRECEQTLTFHSRFGTLVKEFSVHGHLALENPNNIALPCF